MTRRRPPTRRQGFTLAEVLVAAALAAVVGLGVTAAYVTIQRQSRAVTAHATEQRGLAHLRGLLQADLAAIVPLEDPRAEPGGASVAPDGQQLRLCTFAPGGDLDAPPGGEAQVVTWTVQDAASGAPVLVRQVARAGAMTTRAFPEVPLVGARFQTVDHAHRRFVLAELEVGDPATASRVVRVTRALPRASRLPGWRVGPAPAAVRAAIPAPTGALPVVRMAPVYLHPL